ncbi:hypothetical protein GTP58_30360 [Duganella sp. CY15W]|uniref:hypothetical protein n=1 Tax=Duganella sp. CY15W TaxID=2692172 RepID=UPI00136CCC65|nr:hypothetical protein [Duganella sp. CY15W]MYM32644.1 hypothetical protein [Duganella sp. CY15W]
MSCSVCDSKDVIHEAKALYYINVGGCPRAAEITQYLASLPKDALIRLAGECSVTDGWDMCRTLNLDTGKFRLGRERAVVNAWLHAWAAKRLPK